jgi:epidermal growth factor receptor substrate 15
MADLNLTPEEKRVFQHLFHQADTEKLGVITGEIAVKFFERTKLAPAVLGEIWQIADTENRGLLTMAGFCQVLRLIGHYQAGRDPSPELAFRRASHDGSSSNSR